MAGTYTQIYIHTIFAVKSRNCLIQPHWEEQLYKYITGIVQNKDQKMLVINGMPNHIHFLIGMKPSCCLSDLVREVKKSSTEFVRENHFTKYKFSWQNGFGAFSYGRSQLDAIIRYIRNQKRHHAKKSFGMEYVDFLKKFSVDFNPKYVFDPVV